MTIIDNRQLLGAAWRLLFSWTETAGNSTFLRKAPADRRWMTIVIAWRSLAIDCFVDRNSTRTFLRKAPADRWMMNLMISYWRSCPTCQYLFGGVTGTIPQYHQL